MMSDDPRCSEQRLQAADKQSVYEFASLMIDKLRENAHKAHWSTVDHIYLFTRLEQEVKELNDALDAAYRGAISPRDAARECADVANFAMMLADNLMMKDWASLRRLAREMEEPAPEENPT